MQQGSPRLALRQRAGPALQLTLARYPTGRARLPGAGPDVWIRNGTRETVAVNGHLQRERRDGWETRERELTSHDVYWSLPRPLAPGERMIVPYRHPLFSIERGVRYRVLATAQHAPHREGPFEVTRISELALELDGVTMLRQ